jgi:hypothetical protein
VLALAVVASAAACSHDGPASGAARKTVTRTTAPPTTGPAFVWAGWARGGGLVDTAPAAAAEASGVIDRPERPARPGPIAVTSTRSVAVQPASATVTGAAKPGPTTTTVSMHGAYVNDVACLPPQSFAPDAGDPTHAAFACGIGSFYTGGLNGHTVGSMTGTIDLSGNIAGTYQEWFYGSYSGEDGSFGAIHFVGVFSIDGKTNGFIAKGRIVEGTCSFSSATGTLDAAGQSVAGGLTVVLTRPVATRASSAACNPVVSP